MLWDVDLTLINLHHLGGSWYRDALTEVTGRDLTDFPPFAGRTDRWITRELLTRAGLTATEDLIADMHAAAVAIARKQRARIAALGVALPGAVDMVRALATLPGVVQTLVTGNLRPIAGYKVAAFGFDQYLDLDIGGYGAVSEHRPELVAEALTKATVKHGAGWSTDSIVIVGDTPHDMAAAEAHGLRAVGVATGLHTAEDLHAAGAHVVLPDLANTTVALSAILPGWCADHAGHTR